MPRRKACDHAPEGSASESAVSRNTRSSERRNIPEAGRPEEPGRCKLPLARSLQLRSVRRQHRNSFEMPHFRFLIRADSVRVFFFCRFSNSRRFGFEFCNHKNCSHIRSERRRPSCKIYQRNTAEFALCGEKRSPAGTCPAKKINRAQALVCENHERSITLEKNHSCRHRRRNPYGQKTSRDEVLRRNLIAARSVYPRRLTEGR